MTIKQFQDLLEQVKTKAETFKSAPEVSEPITQLLGEIQAKEQKWQRYTWPRKWLKRHEQSDTIEEYQKKFQLASETIGDTVLLDTNDRAKAIHTDVKDVQKKQVAVTSGMEKIEVKVDAILTLTKANSTPLVTPKEIKALPRKAKDEAQINVMVLVPDIPFHMAGVFHFYKGSIEGFPKPVVVKRQFGDHKDQRDLKRLDREMSLWSGLSHPNVLPALGWQYWKGDMIEILMPYVENKDVSAYLYTQRENRGHVQRFKLIVGLARAIQYLHGQKKPIVHGRLEPRCVLVGADGDALLTNFSASKCVDPETLFYEDTHPGAGHREQLRYTPPEKVGDFGEMGPGSDVWSWSLIALLIISGSLPWKNWKKPDFSHYARQGILPELKDHPTEVWAEYPDLWSILASCWELVPRRRPSMNDIVARLDAYPEPWNM